MHVAKQLASLAGPAPCRVLPAFGLQPASAAERTLFQVPAGQRGAVFDEALTLLRLMLSTDQVSFHGTFFSVDGASVGPLPARPVDIWLGGSAPPGLRRVGRLADGWLGSLLTPAEAGHAVGVIKSAADEAGREVDPDHFGISLAIVFDGIPDVLVASIQRRRPDADPATLIADCEAFPARTSTSPYRRTLTATTGATTKELMTRLGHSSTRAAMIYQLATKDRDKTIADGLGQLARDARPPKANPE